jgi:outer membrane lipoprotein-sorting protein
MGPRATARGPRGAAAVLALALTLAAPAGAAPPAPTPPPAAVRELVAKVDEARAGLVTLTGAFTQRKRLALFRDEVRSTGRFALQRPTRLRWEYLSPDASVTILDGTRVTVKLPGAKPETHDLRRRPGLRALLVPLLAALGAAPLKTALRDFAASVPAPATLRLVPRGDLAARVQELELRFDAAFQIAGVRLREKNGDHTVIELTGLRRNPKLAPGTFTP